MKKTTNNMATVAVLDVAAMAAAMVSNGYNTRLGNDRRAHRAAAVRRAAARRAEVDAAHRRIYEEAVRRLKEKKAAAKKAAALARYHRRVNIADQIVAKNKARKSFVEKEAARWKCRLERVEAYKRLYLALSVVTTEKMARVMRAAIEGTKALMAFINGGCRALVTKGAKETKKISFDLQRFAGEAEKVEVDVNSADASQLEMIAGFGSRTVSAIIEERTINGVFDDVDDFINRVTVNNRRINWAKAQSGNYVPVVKKTSALDDFEGRLLGIIKSENHELDGDIRRQLMNKGMYSTVMMQSYEAVVNKNSRVGVLFRQDIVSQPASMFTEPYADKKVRLYDGIKHPVTVKYGTDKLAAFNSSSLVSLNEDSKSETVLEAINFRNSLMNGDVNLVMADVKKNNGRVRRHLLMNVGGDEYISLTRLMYKVDSFGNKTIDNEVVMESEIVNKLAVFNGELIIYSTSQARQDNFMAFNDADEDASKMAVLIFNEATFGQYSLRAGEKIPAAMAVDLTTRLSSHTCGLGMRNAAVQSFCVLTGKDDQLDGEGLADQTQVVRMFAMDEDGHMDLKMFQYYLEKVHGIQVQCRPYTAKATAHIHGDHYVARTMRNMNLFRAYVADNGDIINADTEENVTEFFNENFRNLLVKGCAGKSKFKAYDGVVVYSSKKEMNYCSIPAVVGDRNFWKDVFDVRKISGLNVVMVPHSDDEDLGTWTAAQFWKIPRYAAVQAHEEDEYDTIAHEYAYRGIDYGVNFTPDHEVRYGFAPVDTSFTEGLLRNLNVGEEDLHPTLFRGLINDAARRIEKMIQLDRYPIAGHVGMFDVDPAYLLLRAAGKTEEDAMENGILKIENNVMEVYDPFANKFFDREGVKADDRIGVLMKYPAINLCESGFVKFLTDEEMAARINALDLDEEDKVVLAEEIAAVKEGSVLLPANLSLIGKIWAGSDRDGDKGAFFFRTNWKYDIVAAMQRWGFKSQGVHIHIDSEPSNKEVMAGIGSFAVVNAMQAALHNEKVGPVTNASRVLVQPALYGNQDISDAIKYCLIKAFAVCFSDGKGKEAEYTSPYETKVEDGYTVVESFEDQYDRFMDAVSKLDFKRPDVWDQVIHMAKDFGNLGRHTQEGTIDAAKKFYKVIAGFVELLRQVLTITPIRYGVKFEINWKADVLECTLRADKYSKNVCSVMYKDRDVMDDQDFHGILADDVVTIYADNGKDVAEKKVVPDFFAGIRRDAISYALDQLNALVDTYESMLTNSDLISLWADRAVKAAAMIKKPQQKLIRYALGMVDVIRVNYRAMSEALTKKYIDRENMSDTEIAKVDSQIRRVLHENFDDMMSAVNNMIRIAGNGVATEALVDFVAGGDEAFTNPSSRYAGILKEETAKVAIARSKNNLAYKKLYGDLDATVAKVTVADKEVYAGDKMAGIRVNVDDGVYNVAHLDDGAYITRPLADFVEIPEADFNHVSVMPYLGGYNKETGEVSGDVLARNIAIIEELNACKDTVTVTVRRNDRGYEQMCLMSNGRIICDLYQGYNNSAISVMKRYFRGFTGHIENVLYPDDKHLSSAVIVLEKDNEQTNQKKEKIANGTTAATVALKDIQNFKF